MPAVISLYKFCDTTVLKECMEVRATLLAQHRTRLATSSFGATGYAKHLLRAESVFRYDDALEFAAIDQLFDISSKLLSSSSSDVRVFEMATTLERGATHSFGATVAEELRASGSGTPIDMRIASTHAFLLRPSSAN
jgi:hypothetical protein